MYENEFIVYVERNGERKFDCKSASINLLKKLLMSGEMKIIYYETFKSSSRAKLRLKKMQSLSRLKLIELIKGSNPEMLNLINCI